MRDLSVVFMTHVANLRTFMNIGSILSANDAVDELRDKIGRSGRVKRAVENYNALARIPMWNIWRNQAVKQSGVFSDETDGPLLITIFTVPHGDANGAVLHYDPPVSVQDYISSGGGGASMTKDRGGDFQTDNDELFDVIIAEASYAVQWLNARASGQDDSHQSDLRKLRVFTEGLRIPTGLPDFREGVTIDPTHFYERLVNGALMYKVDDTTDDFFADPFVLDPEAIFLRTSHRNLERDDFWWVGAGEVFVVQPRNADLNPHEANYYGTIFPAGTSGPGNVAKGAEEIRSDRTVWYEFARGWTDKNFYSSEIAPTDE